ncbi:MAG: hypothetical protein IJY44_04355 [Bacteroidaceae bacterium]|nr:hypothetical protein [Bacteroidaceae bacterium]
MGLRDNFKALHDDARAYASRSIDCYKLTLVKRLSLLFGEVACGFVMFMLLFCAFIFGLVAMVALLAPVTGLPAAILSALALLLVSAAIVYCFKVRLFVDVAVKRLCRILYEKDTDDE